MQNKDQFTTRLTNVPLWYAPRCTWQFVAPIAVSRFEGIRQCSASVWVNDTDRHLYMRFHKNATPMVVHFSGLAFSTRREESAELSLAPNKLRISKNTAELPAVDAWKELRMLRGTFAVEKLGTVEKVAILPEGHRPKREVRCLAPLLINPDLQDKTSQEEDYVGMESIGITVQTDGSVLVQGGYVHSVDKKGHMRRLEQKKRGRVCLDGVRFLTCAGSPLNVSPLLETKQNTNNFTANSTLRDKFAANTRSASYKKMGEVVVLEGALEWEKPLRNTKLALARLPDDCQPGKRLSFFTRGRSEERCRVDVDQWGRIFCPESPGVCGVELSGIIFVASSTPESQAPRDHQWDNLDLQYAQALEDAAIHENKQVEEFISRCNKHEWERLKSRINTGHNMKLPLGHLEPRSGSRIDTFNFGWYNYARIAWEKIKEDLRKEFGITTPQHLFQLPKAKLQELLKLLECKKAWEENKEHLRKEFGITTPQQLFQQLPKAKLQELLECKPKLDDRDVKRLLELQEEYHKSWVLKRQPGMTYKYLEEIAQEIAEAMIDRWDLIAQVKGVLDNDFKLPAALEQFWPRIRRKDQPGMKNLKKENGDIEKYEQIRQFFYYHETNGNSMTHCSLRGSTDTFTDTGKWFFPDSVGIQEELFRNIAWLFDKEIYHYISERQTPRFPFIEDFDIQADVDYTQAPPGKDRPDPPDHLIMEKPRRDGNGCVDGDPGELMKKRAACIHKLYSQFEELTCLVYSASGYNKGKEKLKTSFHLVWPQLVVDSDSAPWIREITLMIFNQESKIKGSYLQRLREHLLGLEKGGKEDKSNEWEMVFDKTTINATNGLRLPYNDKASLKPLPEEKARIERGEVSKSAAKKHRVLEGRPSKAIGKIRFTFGRDERANTDTVEAKWVADEKSCEKWEWIRDGSCRIDANDADKSALTPMHPTQDAIDLFRRWKKERKPGVRYFWDGEDSEFATHSPFPNIKLCERSVLEFKELWDTNLEGELEALYDSQPELVQRLEGTWLVVSETCGIWRTKAEVQIKDKDPSKLWGQNTRKLQRPYELIYTKRSAEEKGKVIIDGPQELMQILLGVADMCECDIDDRNIMPLYDVRGMCKY
ncbi:unnamed protein product [Durusdinium trenchii]|uniref:C962R-like N-terminal AEP domain-containing protein n=1 Tax=Durusdinium trenchii TaxID=1381693 RepID=A0ABP0SDT8_9DINO